MTIADGDYGFLLGANSVDDAESLPKGSYVRSMNTVNRGGLIQCRPGYRWRFNLPAGNLQGCALFKPTSGGEQLIFVVEGKVYASAAPYTSFQRVPDLLFSPTSPAVHFCPCEHAVDRNEDGSSTLRVPRTVLMMQDGSSAPGYYDGSQAAQIIGGISQFKTPLGTAMAWSGGRLWVARGRLVFVSDIANPFSFFEGQYVGAIGAFVLPGEVTSMAEIPSIESPALLVFTESSTTLFQSNIRVRALWPTVANFQLNVFPKIGCVSHKAIAAHNGLLWWFSQYGLTNTNLAYAARQSGKFQFADDEMGTSKGYLYSDMSGVAMATFENYLLTSVPYSDKHNTHTWARDTKGNESWNSYWTGTRPVQWAYDTVNKAAKIFYVSKDLDGQNRMWEAFSSDRRDECTPITWTIESRAYTAGNLARKQFRWAEVYMAELNGDVDVFAEWAGSNKGRYQAILSKRITALEGTLSAGRPLVFDQDEFALKKQSRIVRSEEQRLTDPDGLTGCGVTSDREDWIDTGFQLHISCSGPGAIRVLKMYFQDEPDQPQAKCEENEINVRAERFDGGSAAADVEEDVLDILQPADILYSATKTASVSYGETDVEASASAETYLSQVVANKIAQAGADCRAALQLMARAEKHRGSVIPVTA